jgi:hypothetical protein
MNLIKTTLTGLALLSVVSVHAQSARELLGLSPNQMDGKMPSRVIDPNLKTYGVYTLQPKLVALPQSLASRSATSQELGNFTLVATDAGNKAIEEFRKNAVVQNRITGELGVVTGNLTILLKEGVSIQQLEQQFGFTTIESAEKTGVYIVQPSKEQNLLPIREQVERSGLIKVVRLDILEKKYTNQ